MRQLSFLCSLMVLLSLLAVTPAMATGVFTTEGSFVAAMQPGYYLQNLVGLTVQVGFNPGPVTMVFGPTNGYSWTVTDSNAYGDPTGLFEVPGGLSTWLSYDTMTFNFTGSPTLVTAVGGTFFANNNAGGTVNSLITVLLNDGTTQSLSTPGFRGFTSDVGITSMRVWSNVGVSNRVDGTMYAGAGKLYVGSEVPEPLSLFLGGGGLLGLGLTRRWRKTQSG